MAAMMGVLGMGAGTAATGAGALGSVGGLATALGPIMQIAGAMMQVSQYKAQQAEHEREATEARVAGHYEAARLERMQRARRARDKTAMLESGVYSGTGLELEAQQQDLDFVDAALQVYAGEQRGKAADFSATQAKHAAAAAGVTVFTTAVNSFANMDPLNLAPGGGAVRRGGTGPIPQYAYGRPRYGLV